VNLPLLSLTIQREEDVVMTRRRARLIAELLGFDAGEQTRIATAVSEIARNAFNYAGGGRAEFFVEGETAPQVFLIRISDRGPGIPHLAEILDGRYRSPTGMGMGIIGTRRLMDQFRIEFLPEGGTSAWLSKILPRKAPAVDRRAADRISKEIARQAAQDPFGVIREQNQELLRTLEELRRRQDELSRLNRELEDTNRGVVALYAELDEKADHLRRADELKSRFLSNMSHEFRTPVNSIRALSQLLIDRTDGDITPEQERQIRFIQKAAEGLGELVDDLLDLAKVEAGKIVVHPVEFEVGNLFGALRGMLRPLLLNDSVNLVFEDPSEFPPLHTDEGKVSQILRNFISNALKFTPRGEVRVSARLSEDQKTVIFSVADTGIGIAAADQELIFKEFTQIPNPLQKRVKGTGLGLPLCRKLADLLGGSVSVHSEPGVGSTFSAAIPRLYESSALATEVDESRFEPDPLRTPVLVVEDSYETVFIYEKFLNGSGFQLFHARNIRDAERMLAAVSPRAILLDILLKGEDTWGYLARLKADPATRKIPVVVVSRVEDSRKCFALGADAYCAKPVDRTVLLDRLRTLTAPPVPTKILIIDDDQISRYLLGQIIGDPAFEVLQAGSGAEGLQRARDDHPHLIFLDLKMPGLSGFEVLEALRAEPTTRQIPVIIVTSTVLTKEEERLLAHAAAPLLPKNGLSRKRVMGMIQETMKAGGGT
jgi:signal transduction histidine kinase/DNA-binding response OmpR family regulator